MTTALATDTLLRMRWFPLSVFSVLAVGCFSPEAPAETDGSGDSTNHETDSGPTGGPGDASGTTSDPNDSSGAEGPTTTGQDSEVPDTETTDPTVPGGDTYPVISTFEVNGSTTPEDVTRSSMVRLTASASDDLGVVGVDFYDGDTLLGTATEEPYELETLVTSVNSGGHAFHAVATDTADQQTESDDVQLFVDISGGELWDVEEDLFRGCQNFYFGGVAFLENDRLVVAGTACGTSVGTPIALTLDNQLNVASSDELDGHVALTPTTMPNGEVLVPTMTAQAQSVWRYLVFDPTIGAVQPGAGLQFSNNDGGSSVAATALGDGIFLQRSGSEVALLEGDLDSDIWTDTAGDVSSPIATEEGDLLLVIAEDACAGAADVCIRKYSSKGSRLWTRGIPSSVFYQGLAPHPDGGAFYTSALQTSDRVRAA